MEPTTIAEEPTTAHSKLAAMLDELALEVQLGRAEARDELEKAEAKWRRLEGRLKIARQLAEETAQRARRDVVDLVGNVHQGFEKIRRTF